MVPTSFHCSFVIPVQLVSPSMKGYTITVHSSNWVHKAPLLVGTGSKVFLWNTRWFTHSSARPILSFLSLLFTCQLASRSFPALAFEGMLSRNHSFEEIDIKQMLSVLLKQVYSIYDCRYISQLMAHRLITWAFQTQGSR